MSAQLASMGLSTIQIRSTTSNATVVYAATLNGVSP